MILSDRDIRAAMDSGRLVVEPLGPNAIQPSSVDVRIGSRFRVFANSRYPYIDVHEPMEDLTELVEVDDDTPFILHPGEFVLGTTLESVTVPDDLVARLEGKSSLARLGLLIHSSLPAGEPVLFLHDGEVRQRPIDEIVRKQLPGSVVSFDPDSFEVAFTAVTGWYEGPPDRIHEVVLSSGRRVRVTAGHNLFTLDRDGHLTKTRTGALAPGTRVALPRAIPDPPAAAAPALDLRDLMPEAELSDWMCEGPSVRAAWRDHRETCRDALASDGIRHLVWYEESGHLTVAAARQVPGLVASLGDRDLLRPKGATHGLAPVLPIDTELAWLLGMYVAEGCRRRQQVVVSNEDPAILDRVEAILADLGLGTSRNDHAVVACSVALSSLFEWIGLDGKARDKRLPDMALGWPTPVLAALLDGFIDGDGSREETRNSLWTSSPGLVDDLLLLCTRLGLRAGACSRERETGIAFQVSVPHREHKLLTAIPLPDRLLVAVRDHLGLTQVEASRRMGERYPTNLCNIENRVGRDAVRRLTLVRILDAYREAGRPRGLARLERLVEGGLLWDTVVEVRDTGERETIFDLEVRPEGRAVENFLAGGGGVFVSNTAGFVDAGWTGHLTLELSNVANLPITLYPGMKIGQLAFFQLSSSAEHPYGSSEVGSKYHGQHDPTPSRYHLNFDDSTDD